MKPEDDPARGDFDVWIEAGHTEKKYWTDLWRYRELFFILAWRDVAVRYKQTIAGVTWPVLQPVLHIGVMTLIFGKVAGPSEANAPYALMVVMDCPGSFSPTRSRRPARASSRTRA